MTCTLEFDFHKAGSLNHGLESEFCLAWFGTLLLLLLRLLLLRLLLLLLQLQLMLLAKFLGNSIEQLLLLVILLLGHGVVVDRAAAAELGIIIITIIIRAVLATAANAACTIIGSCIPAWANECTHLVSAWSQIATP
jgi:hypothetical protein